MDGSFLSPDNIVHLLKNGDLKAIIKAMKPEVKAKVPFFVYSVNHNSTH